MRRLSIKGLHWGPRRIAVTAIGACMLAGLAYRVLAPKPIPVEIAKAERKTFQELIKSDGILRSKDRYVVPAFADGDIKRVNLKVGDPVRKGQTITELYWDIKYDPVRSPIAGVVSKVFRETAGPIRRGEPIVEVIDPDSLEAVVEMLTTDAARVKPGDSATVEGWGKDPPLRARVVRVSKAGFTKQSALGVEEEKTEVTMDLLDASPSVLSQLGSTFHVDVSIVVATYANALVVPVGTLFRDQENWAVYTVENGRARMLRVVSQARSGDSAMISEGIAEGQQVINFPGDLVKDGVKVMGD